MNRTDLPLPSSRAPAAGSRRPLTRVSTRLAGGVPGAKALVAIGLALGLAACGGGGDLPQAPDAPSGSQNSSTQNSSTQNSRNADPAQPSTAVALAAAPCGIADFEAQVIAQLNQIRAQARSCGTRGDFGAVHSLAWNDALHQAAAGHSADMAQRGYFSHTSPEGQTMSQRVTAAGYTWTAVAENIAAGQTDITAALAAWVASDGHCANLMGAAYRDVALSCVPAANGTRYWTMNLARR